MNLVTLFSMALQALLRNKSRSLLTTLGIVIGVGAVILLTSIGSGLQKYIEDQFESLGANTLYVMPYDISNMAGMEPGTSMRGFNQKDLQNISRLGKPIIETIPVMEKSVKVSYRGITKTKRIWAGTANMINVGFAKLEEGRFFTEQENNQGRRVALVGANIVSGVFNGENPVGRNLTISSTNFKIIGTMEKKGGGMMGQGPDDIVYLPINSAQRLFNVSTYDYIMVKLSSPNEIASVKKMITKKMLESRETDEFSVIDQTEMLKTINNIIGVLTAGIGGIAAISLLVGGIGIMNIMLVSVTERTQEIGLRKAIGATPRIILFQFLIESVVLSLLGGTIGVGLGMGGSLILNKFFPSAVTFFAISLAFGVSAIVGVVFGILPARRAAKLSPINALRYE